MKRTRIMYVGPALAGRRQSLTHLVRHFNASDTSSVIDQFDRELAVGGGAIVAAVASQRSQYFGDPNNPEVQEELVRVLASAAFIFVVDSQEERVETAQAHLALLRQDLLRHSRDLDDIPVMFQLNKRDLQNIVSVAELRTLFRTAKCGYQESVASQGRGIVETFVSALAMLGLS